MNLYFTENLTSCCSREQESSNRRWVEFPAMWKLWWLVSLFICSISLAAAQGSSSKTSPWLTLRGNQYTNYLYSFLYMMFTLRSLSSEIYSNFGGFRLVELGMHKLWNPSSSCLLSSRLQVQTEQEKCLKTIGFCVNELVNLWSVAFRKIYA